MKFEDKKAILRGGFFCSGLRALCSAQIANNIRTFAPYKKLWEGSSELIMG
jgi:hypothetical protein